MKWCSKGVDSQSSRDFFEVNVTMFFVPWSCAKKVAKNKVQVGTMSGNYMMIVLRTAWSLLLFKLPV